MRAAAPLARNLEAACADRPLQRWRPQGHALQLIGDQSGLAWANRGRWHLGASRLLWALKQRIDQRFMAGFAPPTSMAEAQPMGFVEQPHRVRQYVEAQRPGNVLGCAKDGVRAEA